MRCYVNLHYSIQNERSLSRFWRKGKAAYLELPGKQLGTWRISSYTPEYRETSGDGRRRLLAMQSRRSHLQS